ncbi:hypothetical protein ACH4D5_01585 [Streptomyces sp. NPDC018029]|uniref:hypothetical protein n=1 Tax=Streptomyces sp. NPDC018029 TaxID=3365032 RepID=UPI00379A3CD9
MRVLTLSTAWAGHSGGIVTVNRELSIALADMGHDVTGPRTAAHRRRGAPSTHVPSSPTGGRDAMSARFSAPAAAPVPYCPPATNCPKAPPGRSRSPSPGP